VAVIRFELRVVWRNDEVNIGDAAHNAFLNGVINNWPIANRQHALFNGFGDRQTPRAKAANGNNRFGNHPAIVSPSAGIVYTHTYE
jgi:hypothetical protein